MLKKTEPKKTTVTGKFLAILVCSTALAIACFVFLYRHRDPAYIFLYEQGLINHDRTDWIEEFLARAGEIVIDPDDEEGMRRVDELFDLRDYYSGIIIYDHDKEFYINAVYPEAMNNSNLIWRLTGSQAVVYQVKLDSLTTLTATVAFKDQMADVYFFSYHYLSFYPWYLGASLLFCVLVFLAPILWFLHRKVREIKSLKTEILYMAEGNLERPIHAKSRDEFGILAEQLDFLRKSLNETIQGERESREANSDLIRAISHDLRTPLTILSGYLEIVKLHRGDAALEEQYLTSCLNKVLEIRELSDKMFEYAMVYETQEDLELEPVPIRALLKQLQENVKFMELAGFTVDFEAAEDLRKSTVSFPGNPLALKRVFNNLFSNILKYGEKKQPVKAAFSMENGHWRLTLHNRVKQSGQPIESNHIGLKSVKKIMELHGGSMYCLQAGEMFSVEVTV